MNKFGLSETRVAIKNNAHAERCKNVKIVKNRLLRYDPSSLERPISSNRGHRTVIFRVAFKRKGNCIRWRRDPKNAGGEGRDDVTRVFGARSSVFARQPIFPPSKAVRRPIIADLAPGRSAPDSTASSNFYSPGRVICRNRAVPVPGPLKVHRRPTSVRRNRRSRPFTTRTAPPPPKKKILCKTFLNNTRPDSESSLTVLAKTRDS